jgi:photosystem II stability/assembly factor-like uncharacterized protein
MRGLASLFAVSIALTASPASAGWVALPNAPIAPSDYQRHDDLFFVSPDSGWVVNGNGEIHRTTDGGQTWTLQTQVSSYLRCVGFATRMKGWAGTLFGDPLLYATQDAGVTWTPVNNIPAPLPNGICGLSVVNESVAYGVGRFDGPPAVLIKTIDGGATWTSRDMEPLATALIDCHFFDANHGLAVGGIGSFALRHAVILSTSDGGVTWQTRYTSNRPGAEWCWKISFPTRTTGYVSIERQDALAPRYVAKTTDGGSTWTEVPFVTNYDEEGIGFVSTRVGWAGGWTGDTYETIDGGASWHLAGWGVFVNRIRFLSPTLGYASGQTVYKYTVGSTDVEENPSVATLALAQNRPNPVVQATRIAFILPAAGQVRVTIHDVLGRTRATLVDGWRPAGRSELTWDTRDREGNRVSAGVYWYRIETPSGTAEKKLVVVR